MDTENIKDNEIVVYDLNTYLQHISEIRNRIIEEEGAERDAQKFFFRGQANIDWEVTPGIYRDNFLSSESELISEAFLRNPSEFRALDTNFEKLAKFQHYGLPNKIKLFSFFYRHINFNKSFFHSPFGRQCIAINSGVFVKT